MEHWLDKVGTEKRIGTIYSPYILLQVLQALRAVKMPANLERVMLAQVAHESNSGTSSLAKDHNNYSGIRCNKAGLTSGCTSSGFATYATINNWASDYKRILSMKERPIDATSAQDFFIRLGKNNYYVPGERVQYSAGFNARLKEVDRVLSNKDRLDYAIKTGIDKDELPLDNITTSKGEKQGEQPKENFWDKIPWYGKVGIGFGALVIGVAIIKD